MAKDLPYFKFNVSEYINGDITLEDFYIQGVFINICAFYWFKSGNVSLSEMKRRLSKAKPKAFEKLIESNLIKVKGDVLRITFLDEQLSERTAISESNAKNGKQGGRGNKKSEPKPTALISESELKAEKSNIEEKREEEKREREEYTLHGSGKFSITIAKRYAHEKIQKIYSLEEYFTSTGQIISLKESRWTMFDEFVKANSGKVFNEPDHVYNTFRNFCIANAAPSQAANEFINAEVDKANLTLEAWETMYAYDLKHNEKFKNHFGYNGKLSPSQPVGSNNKR